MHDYGTLKSNKQRLIYETQPHPKSKSICCSRELFYLWFSCHMGRVPGSAEERTPLLTFLKSCRRPLRYLICNWYLSEFTLNLAKSFKITSKKIIFIKVACPSQQICWKINCTINKLGRIFRDWYAKIVEKQVVSLLLKQ